jgi:hypothetical protein
MRAARRSSNANSSTSSPWTHAAMRSGGASASASSHSAARLGRELVALPDAEVEGGLDLLGSRQREDVCRVGEAELVDDVVELVARQRAHGAFGLGPREERVRAAQLPAPSQLRAVAGQRDDVVVGGASGLGRWGAAGRRHRPLYTR